MAGYSGTPLPKKLGIKEGALVSLVAEPPDFARETLGALPAAVAGTDTDNSLVDVIVWFVEWMADLEAGFSQQARRLQPAGGLWVAWPKRASGRPTDLTENLIREVGLLAGLVDNKVCAIDETWSGLRLIIRVEHR